MMCVRYRSMPLQNTTLWCLSCIGHWPIFFADLFCFFEGSKKIMFALKKKIKLANSLVWVWHYILSGVMFCQNLCAHCQKLSYGSVSMLHCHCVCVSHLGPGCRGDHNSVNRRSLPSAQSTDGTTLQPAFHSRLSFCFFKMTDLNV